LRNRLACSHCGSAFCSEDCLIQHQRHMHPVTTRREREARLAGRPSSSMGRNALLISLLGFILFFPLCLVGIGFAFASLNHEEDKGDAIGALVFGFIGLVVWIVVLIFIISAQQYPARGF
jgi:hypothetical protein